MAVNKVDQWFDNYGVCHQNATNKLIHWVCVPLIMLSILGLLWDIPVPQAVVQITPWFNWTIGVIALCMVFYLWLSPALAIGMALVSTVFVLILRSYDQLEIGPVWMASSALFVLAWIGQFIGHKIEGKKPAFFDDLFYLLIGPIWLLGFVFRKLKLPY